METRAELQVFIRISLADRTRRGQVSGVFRRERGQGSKMGLASAFII